MEPEIVVLATTEVDGMVYELCVPRDEALEQHVKEGNHAHALTPFVRLTEREDT